MIAHLTKMLDGVTEAIENHPALILANSVTRPIFTFDGETWTLKVKVAPRHDNRVRGTEIACYGETPEAAIEDFYKTLPTWAQVIAPGKRKKV